MLSEIAADHMMSHLVQSNLSHRGYASEKLLQIDIDACQSVMSQPKEQPTSS